MNMNNAANTAYENNNDDDGVTALVSERIDGRWAVVLRDDEADEILPSVLIFKTFDAAKAKADEITA